MIIKGFQAKHPVRRCDTILNETKNMISSLIGLIIVDVAKLFLCSRFAS